MAAHTIGKLAIVRKEHIDVKEVACTAPDIKAFGTEVLDVVGEVFQNLG